MNTRQKYTFLPLKHDILDHNLLSAKGIQQTALYAFREGRNTMATAHDVAAYILQRCGTLSAMKLQKLAYYSQAWSLVWDDRPMFSEPIQAWANGPVVPVLYEEHRGKFSVSKWPKGDPDALEETAKETIDVVLKSYGKQNAQSLSDLTHREQPWRDARKGLPDGERGDHVITTESMMEYYSNIAATYGE